MNKSNSLLMLSILFSGSSVWGGTVGLWKDRHTTRRLSEGILYYT